ncbi:MAG: SDR family oxidoreductase [Deltaproteobacteria bacterium]|nr:SDR family oxidoreductase [Deltaproteobacteria bacterium]
MKPKLFSEEFKDKIVLLTGGSGQIGCVIMNHYVEAGAVVLNMDITQPISFLELPESYCAGKPESYFLMADVTKRTDVEAAIEKILRIMGRIDILINCAGISVFTPFEKRTDDEFQSVMDVNVKGTFLVTQAVSGHMVRDGIKGVILNFGSIYGVSAADQRIYGDSGRNSPEVYAMSKASVIHFTRYMARYLSPHGIRVNCLSPGGIFANQAPAFVRNYVYKTPLNRMGTPEDLIGGIFFLTSSMSEYVTGQNLLVDGGFTIGD